MTPAAEKHVNPIALPHEMVDAIVEGWRIHLDHMKAQKLQFVEEQRLRMQVCVASAEVDQGDSSGNAQETVVYVESDDGAKSSDSEWLMTFE